jgi:hypothetical protein
VRSQIVLMMILACALAGCRKDEKKAAHVQAEQAAAAKRDADWQAEREAEAKLMVDPISAAQTIEARMDDWLNVRGGLIIVRGETWSPGLARRRQAPREGRQGTQQLSSYAMPTTTPWYVECGQSGIRLTLGGWSTTSGSEGEIESGETFGATLTSTSLSDDQCMSLIDVVSRKMSDRLPAPNANSAPQEPPR